MQQADITRLPNLYTELPTETSFRLLKLLPLSDDGCVRCELYVSDLDVVYENENDKYLATLFDDNPLRQRLPDPVNTPVFTAISYIWGPDDSTSRHVLYVNGHEVRIRQNLWMLFYDFLASDLFGAEESTPIWVDTLCINQTNIRERGQQVQLMDRIYSLAKRVVVWPGPSDSTTNVLIDFITKENCDILSDQFIEVFDTFLKREYFGRQWIIQEILLAKAIIFLLGSTLVDARPFTDYIFIREELVEMVAESDAEHIEKGHPLHRKLVDRLYDLPGARLLAYRESQSATHSSAKSNQMTDFINPRARGLDRLKLDIIPQYKFGLSALLVFSNGNCADVRDRILSIQCLFTNGKLPADYFDNTAQLYFKVLCKITKRAWEVSEREVVASTFWTALELGGTLPDAMTRLYVEGGWDGENWAASNRNQLLDVSMTVRPPNRPIESGNNAENGQRLAFAGPPEWYAFCLCNRCYAARKAQLGGKSNSEPLNFDDSYMYDVGDIVRLLETTNVWHRYRFPRRIVFQERPRPTFLTPWEQYAEAERQRIVFLRKYAEAERQKRRFC